MFGIRPEPLDIVIIVVIGLLIFGPKRIPEVAKGMGKAIREFRDSIAGKNEETEEKPGKEKEKEKVLALPNQFDDKVA